MEQRHVLSVTLAAITGPDANSAFDVPSGKDLYVPLIGTDAGQAITYSAITSDPNVQATVLENNPTLSMAVHGTTAGNQPFSGTMTFQLFGNIAPNTVQGIINKVNAGLYNGASFYRMETASTFELIQGGIEKTPSKSDSTILPDEFNAAATFNSSGLLAIANTGQPNSATSSIFVTAPNRPLADDPQSLNFGYTIFGQILTGLDVYNDILNVRTTPSNGISFANTPVTIDSASMVSDAQNGVVQISEPSNFNGSAMITVTGTGTDATTAQRIFNVVAAPPSAGSPEAPYLFLSPVANQATPLNTPISFQLTANSLFVNTATFTVTDASTFTGAPANVTVQVIPGIGKTATIILTPQSGFTGTINLLAHADNAAGVHDAQAFTLTVGGSVASPVRITLATNPVNASNFTAAAATGTGTAGQTVSLTVTHGAQSVNAGTAPVDINGNWSIGGIDLTPLSDGLITYTVSISGSAVQNTFTATKDIAPPTVTSIVTSSTNPTTAASVTYTVTFSESVTGVTASEFTLVPTGGLSGSSITSVTGSGATYTVTATTGNGTGTLGLNLVDHDAIKDVVGNPLGGSGADNGNFTGQTFTVNRPPTVVFIVPSGTGATNAATITYAVTFSTSVTGVDTTDFVLVPSSGISGASIAGVTGSGAAYTVTVNTGTGQGTIGLNLVDDDTISDALGNFLGGTGTGNGNFTGQLATVDRTPPTVSSIVPAGANPTTVASANFTVTFSESVTGVNAADFTLVPSSGLLGSSITNVTGSGATYTVTVTTGNGFGTLGLNLVDDDSITDAAGNPLGGTGAGNGNFTGQTYTVNRPPTVSSIVPADATPTSAATVHFGVTFSESVTGVNAADFTLVPSSGLTGSSITSVTGSGATYTVTVNTGSGSGTLGLNLVDDDSITDASGTPLGGTGAGNGNFTGQTFTIDRTAPTVISIVTADASPTSAATVHFGVTFSESVTGVNAADFTLVPSGSLTGASITGVTGSDTTYTVTAITGNGTGMLGLNLIDDDTIKDAAGNPLGGTGADNGDFTGETYTVKRTPSSVVGRDLFYANSSRYDLPGGSNPQTSYAFSDDNAIATDKTAYLPGSGAATFANVSNYDRGINGIMVDLLGGSHTSLTLANIHSYFTFKVGNNNSPGSWVAAPLPIAVMVRPGAGVGGSDRVELIWSDNTIQQEWLEVTVLATVDTGLSDNDVFFFANEIGNTGNHNSATIATTSTGDVSDAVNHGANSKKNIPITSIYDFNKDGVVGTTDISDAVNHGTNSKNGLRFDVGSGGPFVVEYRLEAEDLSGNPITSIAAGQKFQLAGFVRDLRKPAATVPGVFAGFVNVAYDPLATIPTGATVQHNPLTINGVSVVGFYTLTSGGDVISSPGSILGAGGADQIESAQGNPAEQPLWTVQMQAVGNGVEKFSSSFDTSSLPPPQGGTNSGDDTLLYGVDAPINSSQIQFDTAQLTIASPTTVNISPVNVSIAEAASAATTPFTFTVSLSGSAITQTATVTFSTGGGSATANTDYHATSGTLTFTPGGPTTKTITVTGIDDQLSEPNETFAVSLSSPTTVALGTIATAIGTIIDDDPLPTVSINSPAPQNEGNIGTTPILFTVSLSTASGQPTTVNYHTEDVTAISTPGSNQDYHATSDVLSFAAGETSKIITVNVIGDASIEADETFNVVLSNPSQLTLATATGVGTILNDDLSAIVVGRDLFYAGSSHYDTVGGQRGPLAFSDDNAIAFDKNAYLPGAGQATYANVSNHELGVNGIMVDLLGGGLHSSITQANILSDFTFKMGNNNSPNTWLAAPNPIGVVVRLGAGVSGSDRVELIWVGAVQQNWLEVTVKATPDTGLVAADVFFFGNEIGNTGNHNSATVAITGTGDVSDIVNHGANSKNNIAVTNLYDFNRDGLVGTSDISDTVNHGTNSKNGLVFINIGSGGPFAPEVAPATTTTVSTDAAITSALVSSSSSIQLPSLPSIPSWLTSRLSSLGLNHGSIAKYLTHLEHDATTKAKTILVEADAVADELGLDDELLDELLVKVGLE